MLAGSAMALLCAAGHALAGRGMFYRPIRSTMANDLHAGVFTGMWHLITINFTLSGIALFSWARTDERMQRPGSSLRNLPATPQPTSSYRCDLAARGSSSNGRDRYSGRRRRFVGAMKSTGRLDQGCIKEIHKHAFYSFDLDEQPSLLSFNWTEKSAGMTDDDYKQALREYARLIVQLRARRALIDLRKFRYRLGDAEGLGSWWANEIVPLYNRAGLEKFAFVLPEDEQPPPDETPAEPGEGQKFLTKQFGTKQGAISWLTAGS